MYLAAALCMLGLRGWKIGQLERVARHEKVYVGSTEQLEDPTIALTSKQRRLIMWKKV